MTLEISQEPATALSEYAYVPVAFDVHEIFVVGRTDPLNGLLLTRQRVEHPFRKDYDAIPDNHPLDWAARFDMQNWGVLVARQDGHRVGGAIVAHGTPEAELLEGRTDLAVLWDLRVAPAARRTGVGGDLFDAAARWAAARGACQLKIETQNINVPACEFYAAHGCVLSAINIFAYPAFPDEAQLLWYKDLSPMGRET